MPTQWMKLLNGSALTHNQGISHLFGTAEFLDLDDLASAVYERSLLDNGDGTVLYRPLYIFRTHCRNVPKWAI